MRQHTPPPWTVEYFSTHDYYDVTWGPPNDPRERFSILEDLSSEDAHLIAAAPDLLAACVAVVELDGFVGSALMRKRIEEMKAAIAKAREKTC